METAKKYKGGALPLLCLVIPCYNEEAVLPKTAPLFLEKLSNLSAEGKISADSRIIFVNDGSSDSTWGIIKNLAGQDKHFTGICLSRNRGHQNALLAGLMEAKDNCDITISIDADGQHDMSAMDVMIEKYVKEDWQIVYGVRANEKGYGFFKKITSLGFYSFMKSMGAEVIPNHADYRLVSNVVLKELENFTEVNLFLRGLFPLLGFKSGTIQYKQKERMAGSSHYSLSKMLSLATNGITNLSVKPLHMISMLGIIIALLSFVGIAYSVVSFILGKTVAGWASTICIISLFSGIQLICLGIIGEYIGKIYLEAKGRPRFIISERTSDGE